MWEDNGRSDTRNAVEMRNMKNDAIRLASIYRDWLSEISMGRSAHTVASYKVAFRCLMGYLENEKGVDAGTFCSVSGFSKSLLMEWLAYMKDKGLKTQTCNARLAAVRSFLKHVASRDTQYCKLYMEAGEIRCRKANAGKVMCLSKEAVKTILNVPDIGTDAGYRDVVLMSLAYSTGCRIDEALSLRLADMKLDSREPYVMVRGKGNKHRALYVNRVMAGNLRKYVIKFHGLDADRNRLLFFSRIKGAYEKISHEAVRKRLKTYAVKAHERCNEVPLNLHMHLFRHAMALQRLEDGMNIVQLSKEMGHENIQTTMVYLDVKLGMKEKAIIETQGKRIRQMPKKWKNGGNKLKDLFG